ncbi:MAG: hypothetical protein AABZ30_03190 [Myxococcota bacterium]
MAAGADPFDTRATHLETQVDMALRPRPGLWIEASLPWVRKTLDNPGLPPGGVPGHPDVAHKELDGIGDVRAWTRWRAREWLTLSLGLELPTGETVASPYAAESSGHTVMQIGGGTFDPMIEANVALRAGPVEPFAAALAVLVLYANDHGFQGGDQVLGEAGAAWPLVAGRLRPHAGLTALWRGRDRMPRVITEDTGGVAVYASPGISARVWRGVWLETLARLPIVQRPNSLQLVEDYQLFGGVSLALPAAR